MIDVIIIRLKATLMSFGAPVVDSHGVIQPYPGLSMLTGLLANAMGYEHHEWRKLDRLQQRIQYAVRQDRKPIHLVDFQTVDLSQDFMGDDRAWTTRGKLIKRIGSVSKSTHIRHRHYWADGCFTVALTLKCDEGPTVKDLRFALRNSARPLFIGRKACVPSEPLFVSLMWVENLIEGLEHSPMRPLDKERTVHAWWPAGCPGAPENGAPLIARDRRDWRNQIHSGQRAVDHGIIEIKNRKEVNDEK